MTTPRRSIMDRVPSPLLAAGIAIATWALLLIILAAIAFLAGCQQTVRIDPAKSAVTATRDETKPKTTTTTTTVITIKPQGAKP